MGVVVYKLDGRKSKYDKNHNWALDFHHTSLVENRWFLELVWLTLCFYHKSDLSFDECHKSDFGTVFSWKFSQNKSWIEIDNQWIIGHDSYNGRGKWRKLEIPHSKISKQQETQNKYIEQLASNMLRRASCTVRNHNVSLTHKRTIIVKVYELFL